MISNNKAMFGRAAVGEASLVNAVAPKTLGGGIAKVALDTFSQQESAINTLIGRNPLNDMPQASSSTEVGSNIAGNYDAGTMSKNALGDAQQVRASYVDDVKTAQKPIEQALGDASIDKGVGAAAGNDAFRQSENTGLVGAAIGAGASAKFPVPAIAKLAMNKISVAASLSEGYADVKGVLTDSVKQEIAQLIVEKLSLKYNAETGGYESEIPHEIPAPVLAKMENLSATNPQGLVKYMQELLTKPENTAEYAAMTAAIEGLQADVDNYKGIEADNDAIVMAVKNEGGNVGDYDLAQVNVVSDAEDAGVSVALAVSEPQEVLAVMKENSEPSALAAEVAGYDVSAIADPMIFKGNVIDVSDIGNFINSGSSIKHASIENDLELRRQLATSSPGMSGFA